jgi:hypothetical protein
VAKREPPATGGKLEHDMAFMKLPVVWWCFGFFLLSTMTLAVVQGFAVSILKAMHGVSFESATLTLTADMLCAALGVFVGGFVAARTANSDRVEIIAKKPAGVFYGIQTLRLDSAKASLHAARLETRAEKARARAWEASYRQADALRREEQGRSLRAVSEADAMCEARVSKARRSASAIQTIVKTETRYDTTGCPVRERVPADLLQDALRPR